MSQNHIHKWRNPFLPSHTCWQMKALFMCSVHAVVLASMHSDIGCLLLLLNVRIIGASLSEPHTSGIALQRHVYMSIHWFVYLRPLTENLNWTNRYEGVHMHFKFVHMHANALQPQILNAELQVDMMDCSLPVHYLTQHRWIQWVRQRSPHCVYSTPIGLLNARERLHLEQKERVDVGAKEIEICDKLGQAHFPSLLHEWGNRPWHTVSYNCQHHYKNEILNRNSYEKKLHRTFQP